VGKSQRLAPTHRLGDRRSPVRRNEASRTFEERGSILANLPSRDAVAEGRRRGRRVAHQSRRVKSNAHSWESENPRIPCKYWDRGGSSWRYRWDLNPPHRINGNWDERRICVNQRNFPPSAHIRSHPFTGLPAPKCTKMLGFPRGPRATFENTRRTSDDPERTSEDPDFRNLGSAHPQATTALSHTR
jgi:hypothetical protein